MFRGISDATIADCAEKGTCRIRFKAEREAAERRISYRKADETWKTSNADDATESAFGPNLPWEKIGMEKAVSMETIMELYRSGDAEMEAEAKDQIVFRFGKYVMFVMHKYFPQFEKKHQSELFNCGAIGLMNAMRCYDGAYAFTTYSKNFIIHEMSEYTRFVTNIPSPHYAKLQKDVRRAKEGLEADGAEATAEAVAEIAGVNPRTAARELEVMSRAGTASLDEDGVMNLVGDDGFSSIEDRMDTALMTEAVLRIMDENLDERTKEVVIRHAVRCETYSTIGESMNCEPKDVKGIYRKGLRKIRKMSPNWLKNACAQ